MKSGMWMWVVVLGVSSIGASWGQTAGKTDLTPRTRQSIRRVQENAHDVQHNAAIYQWERVNLEVDRIVATARSLEKDLTDSGRAEQLTTLRSRVHDLRTARLARDVDRCVAAAKALEQLCRSL